MRFTNASFPGSVRDNHRKSWRLQGGELKVQNTLLFAFNLDFGAFAIIDGFTKRLVLLDTFLFFLGIDDGAARFFFINPEDQFVDKTLVLGTEDGGFLVDDGADVRC